MLCTNFVILIKVMKAQKITRIKEQNLKQARGRLPSSTSSNTNSWTSPPPSSEPTSSFATTYSSFEKDNQTSVTSAANLAQNNASKNKYTSVLYFMCQ